MSAQTPLLRYTFDEASGNALDIGTAPAANGTFEGGALRTANTPGGFSASALDLSAANTYLTTADPDKLDALSQLTLTAWVNLQGSPVHGNRIMSKQFPSGNFDGFSFAFNNPGAGTISASNFGLNLALGGAGGFTFVQSGGALSANNEWLFVAVTYDGTQSSGNVNFFSGGVAAAVSSFATGSSTAGTLVGNANDFRVGAQSASTISPPVLIDDVRVYGSVLSMGDLENIRLSNIPEPSVAALLGGGLLALIFARRRMVA